MKQINIIHGDSDGFGTDRTMHMHVRQISCLNNFSPEAAWETGNFLILATYELCMCVKDMPTPIETREKYDSVPE